jgi:hypothetical protein
MGHIVIAAIAPDKVYLVFHEGDKGGNHNGATLTDHGRELITEAFTPSGRLDDKGVIAIEYIVDNGFLVSPEGIKTKV